ncbi:MAG TPA: retroviral-like aspartic protease family protein [Rhodopila sp.]|nr:retroviral-like aspartic protease family protein [Rhodopila sp.]
MLLPLTAQAGCEVQEAAAVPLRVAGDTPLVTVEVNGLAATFILDTGAQRSVVSPAATRRLGIARDAWIGTTIRGVGGIDRRANADPRSLSLGGLRLVRRTLTHDTSLTVAELPRAQLGDQVIDGNLGNDFLASFDLDLDIPDGRLTLYHVAGCSGRFLPWTEPYAAIPAEMPTAQAVLVPVVLDGVSLRAVLDSGSGASLLAAPGMYRMGLRDAALDADPAVPLRGFGPRVLTMRQHRFGSLQVGPQQVQSPSLWVAPVRLAPIADMILGADFMARRRVWISFASQQVFVARGAEPEGR